MGENPQINSGHKYTELEKLLTNSPPTLGHQKKTNSTLCHQKLAILAILPQI